MPRYREVFNSAPIAQFHLRYHWNFPRAGDSAKARAITPLLIAHSIAHARLFARYALPALCLRRRLEAHAQTGYGTVERHRGKRSEEELVGGVGALEAKIPALPSPAERGRDSSKRPRRTKPQAAQTHTSGLAKRFAGYARMPSR